MEMTLHQYKEKLSLILDTTINRIHLRLNDDKMGENDWRKREIHEIDPHEFESDFYYEHTLFRVLVDNEEVTRFRLGQFPGCSHILVSSGVVVNHPYRGKGINKLTNKLRQQIAKNASYKVLMCTVNADNEAELKTLRSNRWKRIHTLVSNNIGDRVFVLIKEL